jgi:excisionase family DNA binding protein
VERQTITIEEIADILGIHRNTAYRAAKRGEIPTIRVGGRLLVPKVVLIRILAGETGNETLHSQGGQLIAAP